MRSLLGDPSPVEHQDPIRGAHRLQAVRDHDQRLVARKPRTASSWIGSGAAVASSRATLRSFDSVAETNTISVYRIAAAFRIGEGA